MEGKGPHSLRCVEAGGWGLLCASGQSRPCWAAALSALREPPDGLFGLPPPPRSTSTPPRTHFQGGGRGCPFAHRSDAVSAIQPVSRLRSQLPEPAASTLPGNWRFSA